jgi:protein arginine kinase activator
MSRESEALFPAIPEVHRGGFNSGTPVGDSAVHVLIFSRLTGSAVGASPFPETNRCRGPPDCAFLSCESDLESLRFDSLQPQPHVPVMKCGRCSKPAVLHITELRQGEVQALHLCEGCAKEYLNTQPSKAGVAPDPEQEVDEAILEELDQQLCPNCGIAFKEFRAQGRLGCPHDYVVFEDELLPLLENIHGETSHVGKIPKRSPQSSQLQFQLIKLRTELRSSVEEERYEDAARIRDSIRNLEADQTQAQPNSVPGESG